MTCIFHHFSPVIFCFICHFYDLVALVYTLCAAPADSGSSNASGVAVERDPARCERWKHSVARCAGCSGSHHWMVVAGMAGRDGRAELEDARCCCVGCSLLVPRMVHEMSNGSKIIDSIDAATSHWVPNDYLDGQ